MGLEAVCVVTWGKKSSSGKAHLEPAELAFKGDFRLKIPIADVKSAEAKGGRLEVRFGKDAAVFDLGRDAEKWALKIRYPRGRIEKLGVKPESVISVLGVDDPYFEAELDSRAAIVTFGRAKKGSDIIVVGMSAKKDLARLATLRESIKSSGAIWVVWPKGRKEFREDDVRAHGPAVGLVDVKVMSFSDTLSGLKMVIPLSLRPKA